MLDSSLAMILAVMTSLLLVVFSLRKTILSTKTPTQPFNWWSLMLYKQLALVLIAPVFLSILTVDAFPFFGNRITDEYATKISWIVLYAVIFFAVSLGLGLRFLNLDRSQCSCDVDGKRLKLSRRFAISTSFVGIAILLISLVVFTHKHALLSALLQGANIREIRGYNAFHSNLPGIVASMISFCAWVPAIHAGYEANNKKYMYAVLFLISALLLSGVRGDKGPIVESFVLFGISFAMASKKRVSLTTAITAVFGLFFMFFLVFGVTKLQMPDMDMSGFLAYLMDRLGVGQMAGVYLGINYMDNIAHQLPSGFWLNIFPLSGQIAESPVVAKYIMLELTGRNYDETGVMNSLFLSEAFGMGGWVLLALSPFIVGFSMALSFKFIHVFFRKLFSLQIANIYYIPFALLSLNITGGFADFPLQKVLLVNLAVFVLVYLVNSFCFELLFSNKTRRLYFKV